MSSVTRSYKNRLEKTDSCFDNHLDIGCALGYSIRYLYRSELHRIPSRLFYEYNWISLLNWTNENLGSGNYSADSAICAMLLSDMPEFPLYEVSGIVFFLIPMLVILVVYIRMGLKIRRSTRITVGTMEPNSFHGESRKIQSRKAIVRMLSTMSMIFSA